MDWQTIDTITPEAGHVLFYGASAHDGGVSYTGWIARNGRLYSDGDGLSCSPTHWCKVTPPEQADTKEPKA